MPEEIDPPRGNSINIPVTIHIDQMHPLSPLNGDRRQQFMVFFLGTGMPHVTAIETQELLFVHGIIPVLRLELSAISYQLPATSYQLPDTRYQIPATSYQLPATSYQLSAISLRLTTYDLRLTTYDLQLTADNLQLTADD